ncbi:hypothetical protein [uncultured Gimesia sp.]|uniref:SGNH/GDSL hydrolase family protein n=1 Tax=uncultured Gimesia sp. TaxID=1678688 RepID=UPI0026115457|nr:hypothetical protein [uncultured Gimesia sp.]
MNQLEKNIPIESDDTANQSSKKKNILFRLAALCIGLILSLAVIETVVRVLQISPPRLISKRKLINHADTDHVVYYQCYPDNHNQEMLPVPNIEDGNWELSTYTLDPEQLPLNRLSETPWCVKYEHSSKGIRNREISDQPPEGVMRIACIGDSFVFGEGVPIEKTMARQMESLLGKKYEVINGGQVGANTMDELQILAAIARGANCNRAIFVFIPNDIPVHPQLAKRQKYINDLVQIRDQYLDDYKKTSWHGGYLKSIGLMTAPFEMEKIKRETIQWYLDSYDPRYNEGNLKVLKETIQTIPKIPGCRSVFVIYPLMEGLESGYPLQSIHEKVKAIAEEAGLPVLDLTAAFAGLKTSDLWVHSTDHHPNGKANAIAAQTIVEWLRQDVPWFLNTEAQAGSKLEN